MSNLSSRVRGSTGCERNEDALLDGHFYSFWVDRTRGRTGASTKHRHDGGDGDMNGVWKPSERHVQAKSRPVNGSPA
jgi:hypothetical protein